MVENDPQKLKEYLTYVKRHREKIVSETQNLALFPGIFSFLIGSLLFFEPVLDFTYGIAIFLLINAWVFRRIHTCYDRSTDHDLRDHFEDYEL